MSEENFDTLDKKYVVKYQHKEYSRGFVTTGEFPKVLHRKIYGLVKRGKKVFYRNYNREIKNGFSLMDKYKECYNKSLDEINSALNNTVFFNKI